MELSVLDPVEDLGENFSSFNGATTSGSELRDSTRQVLRITGQAGYFLILPIMMGQEQFS